MLVSPRSPSGTMRTYSFAECLSRAIRQIFRTVASTLSFFSATLPPASLYKRREVCLRKSRLISHWA